MQNLEFTICPGCRVKLNPLKSLSSENEQRYNASSECLELLKELSYFTLSQTSPDFIHQHLVDTYTVQHIKDSTRQLKIIFALIGLFLEVEHNFTGRQIQQAHEILAQKNIDWSKLEAPNIDTATKDTLTILDVLNCKEPEARIKMLKKWSESVWNSVREEEREKVRELTRKYFLIN